MRIDFPVVDLADVPPPSIPHAPNPALIPIVLAEVLFSLTEPFPGKAFEYNRWYERDHFFANGQQLPFFFSGRRFVATRELKAFRHVASGNPITDDPFRGSFLHLYWILPCRYDDWFPISRQNFVDLTHAGRMDGCLRETIHTVLPNVLWSGRRDEDGVPAEMALMHPYPGLVVTSASAQSAERLAEFDTWFREEYAPRLMAAGSPVSLVVALSPKNLGEIPYLGRTVRDEAATGRHRLMHLWFLDAEPS